VETDKTVGEACDLLACAVARTVARKVVASLPQTPRFGMLEHTALHKFVFYFGKNSDFPKKIFTESSALCNVS
jgi:hypothetical protein